MTAHKVYAAQPPRQGERSPKAFIAATRVATSLGYYLTIPLLGLVALRAGAMTSTEVGVLIATHTLFRRSVAVPTGMACDRWGAERVLVVGLAAEAVGYLLLGSSLTFPVWWAAMVVDGLGGAAYNSAGKVILAQASEDDSSAVSFAGFYVATSVGALLGPLMGALLAESGFPRLILVISAVIYAGSTTAAVVRYRRLDGRALRGPAGAVSVWRDAFRPLRNPLFLVYCSLTIPMWFGISLLVSALPLEAEARGLGYFDVGLISSLSALVVVTLGHWAGRRADGLALHERAGLLAAGAAMMTVGSLLCLPMGRWPLYASMLVVTLGELALIAASEVIAVQLAPIGSTGLYLGYMTTAWSIGGTLASLLSGFLLDGSLAGHRIFWVLAAALLAADAAGLRALAGRRAPLERGGPRVAA
ncbi:MFS transporter [Streptomyces sp. NPDC051105]|uniref:MFS transporter n=1 Tax=Streptomyces sp. NPDC051105 TaxID=3154843 RepID=UPI00341F83C2